MNSVLVSALLVGVLASAAVDGLWTDLRAHLSSSNLRGDNFFFRQLPRTLNDANELGWYAPPEESSTSCSVPYTTLCAYKDPSLCLLFDNNGFIAGAEFGIIKSNAASVYPYATQSTFKSKRRFGYQSYIATVYFVDQTVLNAGGRTSLTETGAALWLQNGRGSYLAVPRNETLVTASTTLVKQACVAGQGTAYYWNSSTSQACTDLLPIVPLYRAGELAGFSFQTFGRTSPVGSRWFETITSADISKTALASSSPSCLSTWTDSYGLSTVHIFFTDSAWLQCSC